MRRVLCDIFVSLEAKLAVDIEELSRIVAF